MARKGAGVGRWRDGTGTLRVLGGARGAEEGVKEGARNRVRGGLRLRGSLRGGGDGERGDRDGVRDEPDGVREAPDGRWDAPDGRWGGRDGRWGGAAGPEGGAAGAHGGAASRGTAGPGGGAAGAHGGAASRGTAGPGGGAAGPGCGTPDPEDDAASRQGGTASPQGDAASPEGDAAGRAEGIPLVIAASYRARARGLLGRDGLTGALLLTPASGVHTFRMRFAIDVAYLDRRLTVLDVHTLRPGRLGRPRLRSRHVLEAEAGALERWGVRRGVRVAITPGPSAPPPPSVR
ncbi:uncharacterized membrane protein (UPF0127 family) [Streptomyces demainii]|uniref:Uncharacterized membrane protein (UPF0127 family) n=1 Tax=Streptomyces demainii TaxID=588122 RepID=A0ABT9KXT8_9ACTN|nr:uncharacterized membrane protein (UPF0127 family) [Streptomyces demainii]